MRVVVVLVSLHSNRTLIKTVGVFCFRMCNDKKKKKKLFQSEITVKMFVATLACAAPQDSTLLVSLLYAWKLCTAHAFICPQPAKVAWDPSAQIWDWLGWVVLASLDILRTLSSQKHDGVLVGTDHPCFPVIIPQNISGKSIHPWIGLFVQCLTFIKTQHLICVFEFH